MTTGQPDKATGWLVGQFLPQNGRSSRRLEMSIPNEAERARSVRTSVWLEEMDFPPKGKVKDFPAAPIRWVVSYFATEQLGFTWRCRDPLVRAPHRRAAAAAAAAMHESRHSALSHKSN